MNSLTETDNTLQQRNITRFFAGILIYSLSTTILMEFIPGKFVNVIQLFGLALFGFYWIKLASWKNVSSRYLAITVSLLILWELFIVCHGFVFQYVFIKEHLFSHLRATTYLLPLSVFVAVNNSFFLQKTLSYAYKLGIAFLVLLPLALFVFFNNQNFAEYYVWMLGMPCGFIMIAHPQKRMTVSTIVMLLSLFLITIVARRNIMFSCAMFLFFAFLVMPLFNKNMDIIRKGVIIFSFVIIGYIGFVFFISNATGMFRGITERATDDTRETVFLCYFFDMSTQDLIIGKGLNGTYFCPNIDRTWAGDAKEPKHRDFDDRVYIENGFLQLILNGGIIYLFLYMLVLIPAAVTGFFFSRNMFTKGCAVLILMFILDMIPFGLPTFAFRHFIVWFGVAVCFSKKMRLMSNDDMKAFLTPTQKLEA